MVLGRKRLPMVAGRGIQRGQALAEIAVCCLMLVPLFLLVPVIAKYGHVKQMGQQAARNAAWSASVAGGHVLDARAAAERVAIARNFADPKAPISTTVSAPPPNGKFADPLLGTFSGQTLLRPRDLRLASWREEESPSMVARMANRLPTFSLKRGVSPNRNGYVEARIQLDVQDLRDARGRPMRWLAPFDNLGLRIASHQRLVVDAWNASGSGKLGGNPYAGRTVIAQVEPLVPTAQLKALNKPFAAIGRMPFPVTGQLDKLEFGTIEPDIVPRERLTSYARRR